MPGLAGRVIIVTGASSGIGAAVALACGAQGMRVVLAARNEEKLRMIAEQVETLGGTAMVCPTDMTRPEQINALASLSLDRFGRIDVLLANAGLGCKAGIEQVIDHDMSAVVETNLLGVMRCAHAVLPAMIKQRNGHILTVSSVIIQLMWPQDAIYAATKAGVHRFSKGIRNEVRKYGIHVTDVVPGVIDTPLNRDLRGIPKSDVHQVAQDIVNVLHHPRPTLVTPAWYRIVMAANVILPGIIDAFIAKRS